jgi:ATP-binding protein involved in chromosome partitioning
MAKSISEQEVRQTLSKIKHPAIDHTLIDLGILKDITIRNDKVEITLAFPFPEIPIKDYLINSVQEPIEKLGAEVEVKIDVMNDEERQAFLAMEEKSWKGI